MTIFPTLYSARFTFRETTSNDLLRMTELLNNQKISQHIFNIPFPFTLSDAQQRLAFMQEGFSNKNRYIFVITHQQENEMIGQIGLHLNTENNHAEMGYWIGEPFWGQGIATEGIRTILEFGFETLGLHKIFATHFLDNPASAIVMTKNKMIKEAELKEHYLRDGIYKGIGQYRLTKEEYEALK